MAGPRHGGGKGFVKSKPKNFKGTVKRILQYIAKEKIKLIIVFIAIIASALANVGVAYLMKPIINVGIIPLIGKSPVASDFAPLINYIIYFVIFAVIAAIGSFLSVRLMITISNNTMNKIRKELFDKLQDLPIKYFDTNTHGEIMSRFTNDVDIMQTALRTGVSQVFSSGLTIIATFIMMLVLSPLLTLVTVVMIVLMTLVVSFLGKRSASNFIRQQAAISKVNGYIEEMSAGQKVVKAFNREEISKKKFDELNEEYRIASMQAEAYAGSLMPLVGNISYLNYAVTSIVGAIFVINGSMDLGSIAAFLQYTRNFADPISQVTQQFNGLISAVAGAERVFAVIDEEPEELSGEYTYSVQGDKRYWVDKKGNKTECLGNIVFDHVDFGYDENKLVLKDINLYAKSDQKVAFVGSTGAGKTTITNLINRFYDIKEGAITYDGIDISKISKSDLRRSMAIVLQDTHLFTGTVMENIRYGRLDATDEEVIAASKLANAHSFIELLPEGYNSVLTSDGENLSQGQRQLLNIARTAVANPSVLILDEATSSIDTHTEALIGEGMTKLMKGRTVFVIAHRLSTVRDANVIMVLEQGEIIEKGSHKELINMGGRYYGLYTGDLELD